MNYQVTALRKRPKTFKEIVGQEFVVRTLSNSISSDTIAQAYLFSGPRGVGKTSVARILATALNAPDGPSVDNWNYKGSVEIAESKSLDVIEIDGASHTSVNDVRAIKDEIVFAPSSLPNKVYIIDEVHMLSISAFNALLKTIEEPPEHVVFIFATTELHKVPATIRSRCQQYVFQRISLSTLHDCLEKACAELNVTAEQEALRWIAREATGSLRDAYTLLDQCMAFSKGTVTLEKLGSTLGIPDVRRILALLQAVIDGDSGRAFEHLDLILSQGAAITYCLQELVHHMRNLLFLSSGWVKEDTLGVSEALYSEIKQQLNEVQLTHGMELIFNCYRDIRYSINQRYELEVLIRKLCGLRYYIHLEDLVKQVERLRSTSLYPEQKQTQKSGGEKTATESGKQKQKPDIAVVQNTLVHASQGKRTLANALQHSCIWEYSEDKSEIIIRTKDRYIYTLLSDAEHTLKEAAGTLAYRLKIFPPEEVKQVPAQQSEMDGNVEKVFYDILEKQ